MEKSTLPKLLFFFVIIITTVKTSSSTNNHNDQEADDLFPPKAVPTKSGYLPISQNSSSAMFYAFYEAQNPTQPLQNTPLLLWLQGGPGCSSMLGNFLELGPWLVAVDSDRRLRLRPNPNGWNRRFGLLFLDNPVGTGLSLAPDPADIPTNQSQVARHLFAAVTAFLGSNPGFASRPVYITGESYAGKYVPAIGYHILKENPGRVNLAGVAIGNGLTDPVIQVGAYANSAYYSGFVNERQKAELEKAQDEAVRLSEAGSWQQATNARIKVLSMLQNMTGLATLYDYTKRHPYRDDLVEELLSHEDVKKALRAKTDIVFQGCSNVVGRALHDDVMKSAKYMVEYLVKRSKVLLYQGFYDLRDGVVSTESWVRTMQWEGIGRFMAAERKVWKVEGELAGYVQRSERLTNVIVLGAGHLVPADRGLSSQAMIEDWVLERGLFGVADEENNEEVKIGRRDLGQNSI